MLRLMTKQFKKWVLKQDIESKELSIALEEMENNNFDANLGGNLYKKRVRFKGKGKSGSGRTIICYKKGDRSVFIHGFSKNEKSNLSAKELSALKEFSKIILSFTEQQVSIAVNNGDLVEVK